MNGVIHRFNGKMLPFSDQSLADTPNTFSSYHHHHSAKPVLQVSDFYLFKTQTSQQHMSEAECRNRNKSTANKPSSWLFSFLKKPQSLLSPRSPAEVKTPGSPHTVYSYTASSGKPDDNFSFSFYVQCCCCSCQKTWHFDLYMRKPMHRHFKRFTQSHQENQ